MNANIFAFLRFNLFVGLIFLPMVTWANYTSQITQATEWLAEQQNIDGSWGTPSNGQFILTTEAVQALRAAGLRNTSYFKGLTWLENHAASNVDYATRRALALYAHGDNVQQIIKTLANAQNIILPERKGWGIDESYLQAPIDTALVLASLNTIGTTLDSFVVNYQSALEYLKASQLSNTGWPASLASVVDPFSTAWVIKAMVAWKQQDSTLVTQINNGVDTLVNSVNINSPYHLQALAAHTSILAENSTTALIWLTNLDTQQNTNGSWSSQVYDTALVIRAFSAADGLDNPINYTSVSIPDANLRKAINTTLGRNALDALDRRELAQLTTLTANNMAIYDLTGLEWAENLTHLSLINNNITDITSINGLSLTSLELSGNPVYIPIKELIPVIMYLLILS